VSENEVMREIEDQDQRVASCVDGMDQAVAAWHSRHDDPQARTPNG